MLQLNHPCCGVTCEDKVAGPFGLNRFTEGRMIDESVAAAVAH